MKRLFLILAVLFSVVVIASAQSSKAQSHQREAEYYQKRAESYRREAEYYLKKADEKAAMHLRWAAEALRRN